MITALKLLWKADPLAVLAWIIRAVLIAGLALTVGKGWWADHRALAHEREAHQQTKAELELAQRNVGHLEAAIENQNQHVDAFASGCTIRAAEVETKVQTLIKQAVPPPKAAENADSMNLYLQTLRGNP